MKVEKVEIFSDRSNMAVMRHPRRNYPGSLIQGDSLFSLIQDLEEAQADLARGEATEASDSLGVVIASLSERLEHYKEVLRDHNIELPFNG